MKFWLDSINVLAVFLIKPSFHIWFMAFFCVFSLFFSVFWWILPSSFRWKLQKTICGFERMDVYIKNCAQQPVKYRSEFIVHKIQAVPMQHMWVTHPKNVGDRFQHLASIVCDCGHRWVPIQIQSNSIQLNSIQSIINSYFSLRYARWICLRMDTTFHCLCLSISILNFSL